MSIISYPKAGEPRCASDLVYLLIKLDSTWLYAVLTSLRTTLVTVFGGYTWPFENQLWFDYVGGRTGCTSHRHHRKLANFDSYAENGCDLKSKNDFSQCSKAEWGFWKFWLKSKSKKCSCSSGWLVWWRVWVSFGATQWGILEGKVLIISSVLFTVALMFMIACLNLGGIDMLLESGMRGRFLLLVPGVAGTYPSNH